MGSAERMVLYVLGFILAVIGIGVSIHKPPVHMESEATASDESWMVPAVAETLKQFESTSYGDTSAVAAKIVDRLKEQGRFRKSNPPEVCEIFWVFSGSRLKEPVAWVNGNPYLKDGRRFVRILPHGETDAQGVTWEPACEYMEAFAKHGTF